MTVSMKDGYMLRPIGYIRTDFNEKFGIPKQCGLVDSLEQRIVFSPEFSNIDALRGIEDFTHLWLIWGFSENPSDMSADELSWSPTVRPPRLGGGIRKGVWASRSPYRPNSLGLSCVKLLRVELDGKAVSTEQSRAAMHEGNDSSDRCPGMTCVLSDTSQKRTGMTGGELAVIVTGADLVNGTPIYDIKPYLPFSDSHPEASSGYSAGAEDPCLDVIFPEELLEMIDEAKRDGLIRLLSLDPRDAYNKADGREYGLSFADWNIRFRVTGNVLEVVSAAEL